jgi:hypothetical protein
MRSVEAGVERKISIDGLTPRGRASFEWAVLFSAVALVFPISGIAALLFAERSRRNGYDRWRAAMAVAPWCLLLGVVVRLLLHIAIVP